MKRLTAKDFDQELFDLCGFHAHGAITRREFLDRAGWLLSDTIPVGDPA